MRAAIKDLISVACAAILDTQVSESGRYSRNKQHHQSMRLWKANQVRVPFRCEECGPKKSKAPNWPHKPTRPRSLARYKSSSRERHASRSSLRPRLRSSRRPARRREPRVERAARLRGSMLASRTFRIGVKRRDDSAPSTLFRCFPKIVVPKGRQIRIGCDELTRWTCTQASIVALAGG